MFFRLKTLKDREEGQDLVEYALVLALIALGATVSMQALAAAISTAFTTITAAFNSALG
jgi:pilus assembly protein Flp/PilA